MKNLKININKINDKFWTILAEDGIINLEKNITLSKSNINNEINVYLFQTGVDGPEYELKYNLNKFKEIKDLEHLIEQDVMYLIFSDFFEVKDIVRKNNISVDQAILKIRKEKLNA